jgi:hypothetical protein
VWIADSSLSIVSMVFPYDSWSFNPGADGERQILTDAHLRLFGNDEAGNDAESNLRNYEPRPINQPIERRVHGFKHAVQQS